MSDSRGRKPTDLSNISQGDDSHHGLNSSLNNTTPTAFQEPGGGNNSTLDSHNNGDHDFTGRFNPFGGLPQVPSHQPGDPSFTRQLGPLMGGKHVDDDDEGFQTGDAARDPTFSNQIDDRISDLAKKAAPKLGEKREDEPDGDSFGLDPSQRKLKMD
ncbi:unnamed protein product [Mucor hiemalis]